MVDVEKVGVGKRVKRIDAPAKLTGQERFTGDLKLPGLLYARTVGSAYPHARIVSVNKEAALALPGVVNVFTAFDLPITRDAKGNPTKTGMAFEEALFAGQIVAIVVAESDVAAQDGAGAVEIEYEELPALLTIDQGMDRATPAFSMRKVTISAEEAAMHNADAARKTEGEQEDLATNVSNTVNFTRGDLDAGFAQADAIVEYSFTSDAVHQGYIEPQSALVAVDPIGRVTVYTSTQAAFHCRNRVAETIGVPIQQVNVVPMPVGGGFGGKFVHIEPLTAAVALAAGRPVLLQFTRMEDMVAGNPAPGCRIDIKLGAKRDGTFTALDSTLIFDAGATPSSPMQIAAILLGGYYRFPNMRIKGYEINSHKAGAGSYRAPGAQQASMAIESAVHDIATQLGLDPFEIRLKNAVVEGDPRPNGGAWPKIGLIETLEALQAHPLWQNRAESKAKGRGLGIAVGGWPGGIEPATAICRLEADGTFTIVLGSVDLSGTNTTFAQIVAEELGLDASDLRIVTAPTDSAPFAGGTGGSKITYTVGAAVKKAAEDTRMQILNIAADQLEVSPDDLELSGGKINVKGVPGSSMTLREVAGLSLSTANEHEPVLGRGSSSITESAPGFAVHLVEVEVDEVTGVTTPTAYVAAQDVGFAINPLLVEGQIEGAVGQGLGWALYEGMVFDASGQLMTATLMDYTLPKADMIPPIEVLLVEVPADLGPYGAKGIGEPPAIPGPAAVANAIKDLTGVRVDHLPITPESLAEKLWTAAVAD
jgi:CO/xanthine dehydrogenase Mo-binding subunit